MEKQNDENEANAAPPEKADAAQTAVDAEAVGRLQTENAELKAEIRLSGARQQLTADLAKAGARSPGLLFDAVKDDVQFDADEQPENTAALIERLKRTFPEQFGTGKFETQQPGGIDGGAGQHGGSRLTREALRRMKPSEIAELDWADVKRVLASN